jgi:hypothetical protein
MPDSTVFIYVFWTMVKKKQVVYRLLPKSIYAKERPTLAIIQSSQACCIPCVLQPLLFVTVFFLDYLCRILMELESDMDKTILLDKHIYLSIILRCKPWSR